MRSHRQIGRGVPQYRSRDRDQSTLLASQSPKRPYLIVGGCQFVSSLDPCSSARIGREKSPAARPCMAVSTSRMAPASVPIIWLKLAAVCAILFLTFLDNTIVSVALAGLQSDLGVSVTGLFSPEYAGAPWSLAKFGDLLAHRRARRLQGPQRRLELGRHVADNAQLGRLDPVREQRVRQERPVAIVAVAAAISRTL